MSTAALPSPAPIARELGVPLSVLDLASVAEGAAPADGLRRSVRVAQHAEARGYHRFWVAEHHSMPAVASSAPDVLLAEVGAATSTIRIGSGGVMLPNHAPLVVAERFGILEAFHPGRVDLGIGRAPGTDMRTARALRRAPDTISGDAFLDQLAELDAHFTDDLPADHPHAGVLAMPHGARPPIWLLGSSTFSAQVAALTGRPFAFAYHFAPAALDDALRLYRERFRPSPSLPEPHAMVGVNVVCAPTDDEAQHLAGSGRLMFARMARGELAPVPSPETAAAHPWTDHDRAAIGPRARTGVVGAPATVRAGLEELLARTRADELVVAGTFHGEQAQRDSLSLVAEATGLPARVPVGAAT